MQLPMQLVSSPRRFPPLLQVLVPRAGLFSFHPHMRRGDTALRSDELRRLRGLMMLEHKIKHAATNADIAKEFNVHPETVRRTLSWMKRAGIIVDYEDKVLQELMPLAHEALKKALQKGNVDVALEIFKGMLPSFNKKVASGPSVSSGNELSAYIDQLRGELGVIDGELAESEPAKALQAATTRLLEEGTSELSGPNEPRTSDAAERPQDVGENQLEGAD